MNNQANNNKGTLALVFGLGVAAGVGALVLRRDGPQVPPAQVAVAQPKPVAKPAPQPDAAPPADSPVTTERVVDEQPPDWKEALFPSLGKSRRSANESAAVATLRSLAAAQAMAHASAVIDTDDDRTGEYGFLAELAGSTPLRTAASQGTVVLDPAYLSPTLGQVSADAHGHGVVERMGYIYKVFLPGQYDGSALPGVAEAPTGGTPEPNPCTADSTEQVWCAYAWPVSAKTGTRAFFINQEGELAFTGNADAHYVGLEHTPLFNAALSGDMRSQIGTRDNSLTSGDGLLWQSMGS